MEPRESAALLGPTDRFVDRHVGPRAHDIAAMLDAVGAESLDTLMDEAIPAAIRREAPFVLPPTLTEAELLTEAASLAGQNQAPRSFVGMGYHRTVTPAVIQRNILENPGWYTQYTPYQAEISQGRLEALLNFQTLIADLTGLPLANASLLDEGTAAAEAMTMAFNVARGKRSVFVVAEDCHPQTIAVVQTRARPIGVDVRIADVDALDLDEQVFGVLASNPSTRGVVRDLTSLSGRTHDVGALLVVVADPLSLALVKSPGEMGADVAVGSTQRFGVPMGYGGPHAAYFATHEAHKRRIPGRLIGVSRDRHGDPALRMALQTREQHIRRDRATSNICTSQVLLAVMASMYGVYHGAEGLRAIAARLKRAADALAAALAARGHDVLEVQRFDTVLVRTSGADRAATLDRAAQAGFALREVDADNLGVTLDQATTAAELDALLEIFGGVGTDLAAVAGQCSGTFEGALERTSPFLEHPVFHDYRSEHELLRYIKRLESRDLSLTTSMIPLGSCTMKLNAAAEMLPIGLPGFADIHPFVPPETVPGYQKMIAELEAMLAELTGLPAVSLQPNAGSQGEYAGLLAIRRYHDGRGDKHRNICLIPASAHGTNPASAVMAGMKVKVVACDKHGNVSMEDLRAKAAEHGDALAALMITYPSTHGVFEAKIVEICDIMHSHGGQVYMDGANMNAMVGLCRPGDFGVDVLHLNLHKTFCIPHGGGGPGVGPIAAGAHLAPHMPGHSVVPCTDTDAGAVAAAPWGSAGILPISWSYIRMMGAEGLRKATQVAILNANYLATRLSEHYPLLYKGKTGRVAHEFILDMRPFQKTAGVTVFDVAKRLMDYGFHAPTVSFPVAGTIMIEPTESESLAELDRFCDAMIAIRGEIRDIEEGRYGVDDNPLKGAPHTAVEVGSDAWDRAYGRELAGWPDARLRAHKYWPPVSRIDDAFGDRNLVCTCAPIASYTDGS
jgi:glycine dehydrogenase